METVWIVFWRGAEEICSSPQDAMDRWDQLVGGERRRRVVFAD